MQVEPFSIIAAGAYLEENTVVPSGEVWAGNPAKRLRSLRPAEREHLKVGEGRGAACIACKLKKRLRWQ